MVEAIKRRFDEGDNRRSVFRIKNDGFGAAPKPSSLWIFGKNIILYKNFSDPRIEVPIRSLHKKHDKEKIGKHKK